jgi:hypothetical protein
MRTDAEHLLPDFNGVDKDVVSCGVAISIRACYSFEISDGEVVCSCVELNSSLFAAQFQYMKASVCDPPLQLNPSSRRDFNHRDLISLPPTSFGSLSVWMDCVQKLVVGPCSWQDLRSGF